MNDRLVQHEISQADIEAWLWAQCNKVEQKFPGLHITGGDVIAERIPGLPGYAMIKGVTLTAERDGAPLELQAKARYGQPFELVGVDGP
jgi:hypothetical protein